MSARKPLSEDCNGSIDCTVPWHIVVKQRPKRGFTVSHVPLTLGQRKTLRERREAIRSAPAEVGA